MERIQQLAARLGDALAEHEAAQALKAAREAFFADEEAQRLQKEYDEATTALRAKMAAGQPLEPDEKRREADLRAQVAGHEKIRALLQAQADFTAVMNVVQAELDRAIGA